MSLPRIFNGLSRAFNNPFLQGDEGRSGRPTAADKALIYARRDYLAEGIPENLQEYFDQFLNDWAWLCGNLALKSAQEQIDGPKPRKCEFCGGHFYPKKENARFCPRGRCRQKWHKANDFGKLTGR